MNSWERFPPIGPVSAAIGIADKFNLLKVFKYDKKNFHNLIQDFKKRIGNDFIINTPCINIRYNGIYRLLNIYNELQEDYDGKFYLIKDKKIYLNNFKLIINMFYL